jgi:hypothetical protein
LFLTYRAAYIDLEASRSINGTRQQVVLVEVKCFPENQKPTTLLYTAIGQYLVYRAMLIEDDVTTPLYLSVPTGMFERLFDDAVMRVVRNNKIRLVIIDLETETVEQWIE